MFNDQTNHDRLTLYVVASCETHLLGLSTTAVTYMLISVTAALSERQRGDDSLPAADGLGVLVGTS